jgi:hypothetical protein
MRALLLLAAVALAACAAHPAAAAGPATLDATVAGLLVDGTLRVSGRLAGLASTGQVEPEGSPLSTAHANDARFPPTSLRLAAHHLHAETDVQKQDYSPTVGSPQHSLEQADFTDAVAHATQAREKFQFYLVPLPGHAAPTARLDAAQARLRPAPAAPHEPERKVTDPERPALEPAPGPAVLAAGGLRTLHVEGDLLLTLWEWDLAVPSDGALLRSGYTYAPLAPSAGKYDTLGHSEGRQLFLAAEDATLDLTLPADAAVALALQVDTLGLDGRVVLQRPSGHLATAGGEWALRDGDWVEGAFTAQLGQPSPDAFHAVLDGTGREARLGGVDVAIAAPVPATGGTLVATLAISGMAILGSWRLWGRRPARAPAPAPPPGDSDVDDEVRVLRWLDARARAADAAGVLWDSDLMRAFEWSAERAQTALLALQAKGQVRCRSVALAAGRSLGHVALTAAGADRLVSGPSGGSGGPRAGLRRFVPGRAR